MSVISEALLEDRVVKTILTKEVASYLLTQHVEKPPRPAKPNTPSPVSPSEEVIQISLSLRKKFQKQLARMVDDADMTMRAFVLNASKEKGLSVRADDLKDLRKEKRAGGSLDSILTAFLAKLSTDRPGNRPRAPRESAPTERGR